MKKGIIYKAECMVNGKCYIGQTVQGLNKRRSQHKSTSFNKNAGDDYNNYFHRAIRKHTWNAFRWEILEVDVPEDELDELEIAYIAKFDAFKGKHYNTSPGGCVNRDVVGEDNPNYDNKLRNFYHQYGIEEINITQYNFRLKHDIDKSHLSSVILGKRKIVQGWVTDKKNLLPMFDFQHKSGIQELRITQYDFRIKYNINQGNLANVVLGRAKSSKGWKLINNK